MAGKFYWVFYIFGSELRSRLGGLHAMCLNYSPASQIRLLEGSSPQVGRLCREGIRDMSPRWLLDGLRWPRDGFEMSHLPLESENVYLAKAKCMVLVLCFVLFCASSGGASD